MRAFQKAHGLTVDGVAGTDTMAALAGGRSLAQHKDATGALGADAIGCPVENVRANWPPLLEALAAQGIDTVPCQIATLATVGTEVGLFEPIKEYGGKAYFKRMYEGRKDLGSVRPGDGVRYHGRGYIQLRGRANYRTYGKKLGVPLEKNPDLALRPDVAAKVLAACVADHGIATLAATSAANASSPPSRSAPASTWPPLRLACGFVKLVPPDVEPGWRNQGAASCRGLLRRLVAGDLHARRDEGAPPPRQGVRAA